MGKTGKRPIRNFARAKKISQKNSIIILSTLRKEMTQFMITNNRGKKNTGGGENIAQKGNIGSGPGQQISGKALEAGKEKVVWNRQGDGNRRDGL